MTDDRQPSWMKLTKKYFKCGKKESDLVQVSAVANECAKTGLEVTEKYIRHLSQKPDDISTKPQTNWKIINRFLNSKKYL